MKTVSTILRLLLTAVVSTLVLGPAWAQERIAGCTFKTYSVTGSFAAYGNVLDDVLAQQVDLILTEAGGHLGKYRLKQVDDRESADIDIEAISNPLGSGQVDESILSAAEEYLDSPWLKIGFNRQGDCKLRVTYLLNEYQIMLDQINLHDVDATSIKTASEPYRLADYYNELQRLRDFNKDLSPADRGRRMGSSRDDYLALYKDFPRDLLYAFHLYPSVAVNKLGLHNGGMMEYFNPESVKVVIVEGNNAKRIRLAILESNEANYGSLLQTLVMYFMTRSERDIRFETIRSISDIYNERKLKLPEAAFWLFGKRR